MQIAKTIGIACTHGYFNRKKLKRSEKSKVGIPKSMPTFAV